MSKMNIKGVFLVLLAVAAPALSVPGLASAHHSFAMFDRDKQLTMEGTVKEFQFTNPHSWIQIVVNEPGGDMKEWGVECGAPAMMTRTGWKSTTLKPGDKVTLVIHPLKSGAASGSLVKITLADGRVLGPGGPPPRPGQAIRPVG